MTANEMADELELRIDRSDSLGSPGYEDFDITSVLSEAQMLYVKKFTSEINNRKGQGFEETEVRNQGLSALINQGANLTISASQVGILDNGVFYDLPDDFMLAIYEEAVIDKKTCGTTDDIKATVNIIAHDEISRLRGNKYKKPYYKDYGSARVWRINYRRDVSGIDPTIPATAKRHQLITDGTFAVTNYTMNYLTIPLDINVDRTVVANQKNCILDAATHTVIIDIAKDLMLQRVKEQKIQNIEPIQVLE